MNPVNRAQHVMVLGIAHGIRLVNALGVKGSGAAGNMGNYVLKRNG